MISIHVCDREERYGCDFLCGSPDVEVDCVEHASLVPQQVAQVVDKQVHAPIPPRLQSQTQVLISASAGPWTSEPYVKM